MRRRPLLPRPATLIVPALLLAAAAIPRLLTLDAAVTVDEPLWLERADGFYDALAGGDLAGTVQAPHPGVPTMWLAGAGLRILPSSPGALDDYVAARLPVAFASALLVLAVWWYARRLWGPVAAAAAGAVLALDPFLLAHSRVVHTDALAALLSLAAVLCFLDAIRRGRGFAAAGAWTSLAVLTKGTALLLLPFLVGLFAVRSDRRGARRVMDARLARWVLGLLFVALAAWPAMWVRPWDAVSAIARGVLTGGGTAQEANFFLGDAVRDPGPLFYPVAVALRLTPVTLAGVALALVLIRRRRAPEGTGVLLAFALFFLVAITLGDKKLDRFALPAILALDVAAGLAIWSLVGGGVRRRVAAVAAASILALHAAPGLAIHPHYLAHFNWLLGGPHTARRAVLAGGGEGLDRVGDLLDSLPGAPSLTIATTRRVGIRERFRGRLVAIDEPADYVVFYASSVQAGVAPQIWARYRRTTPVAVVRINTVEKAWVWRRITTTARTAGTRASSRPPMPAGPMPR